MNVFVDTAFYLALLNPRDSLHSVADRLSLTIRHDLVTTTWVLTELADALCRPVDRVTAGRFIGRLLSESALVVVPPDRLLFERGLDLYNSRPDKSWSLTDCISFVVMHDLGITQALAHDRHFEQAGFQCLMRD